MLRWRIISSSEPPSVDNAITNNFSWKKRETYSISLAYRKPEQLFYEIQPTDNEIVLLRLIYLFHPSNSPFFPISIPIFSSGTLFRRIKPDCKGPNEIALHFGGIHRHNFWLLVQDGNSTADSQIIGNWTISGGNFGINRRKWSFLGLLQYRSVVLLQYETTEWESNETAGTWPVSQDFLMFSWLVI